MSPPLLLLTGPMRPKTPDVETPDITSANARPNRVFFSVSIVFPLAKHTHELDDVLLDGSLVPSPPPYSNAVQMSDAQRNGDKNVLSVPAGVRSAVLYDHTGPPFCVQEHACRRYYLGWQWRSKSLVAVESNRRFEDRVRRVCRGDDAAFDSVMREELSQRASGILYRMLGSHESREECLQEAMIDFCGKLAGRKFRPDKGSAVPLWARATKFWVKTVMFHALREARKRWWLNSRERPLPPESDRRHPSDWGLGPPESASANELWPLLLSYVQQLPPEQRAVLTLVPEYGQEGTAKLLGNDFTRRKVQGEWYKARRAVELFLERPSRN